MNKTIDIEEAVAMLEAEMDEMQNNGWDNEESIYTIALAVVAGYLQITPQALEAEFKADVERQYQANKPEFSWGNDWACHLHG
jgi:hypothetical protein